MLPFSKRRVVLAVGNPAALNAALARLDRVPYDVAPTTDALERALRKGPAVVVADGSLVEGEVPLAAVQEALAEAVSLRAFLEDPRGVLKKGRPVRIAAVPPGVYALLGAAGGVGATAAALGLAHRLAAGGQTALVELQGEGRLPAVLARGLGQDGTEYVVAGGKLVPEPPEKGRLLVLAAGGRSFAETLRTGPETLPAFVKALAGRFRYVVVDVGPGVRPELIPARRGFVLSDPRPEALENARAVCARLGDAWTLALVGGRLDALGTGARLKLDPPPDPDRWGRRLAEHLMRTD